VTAFRRLDADDDERATSGLCSAAQTSVHEEFTTAPTSRAGLSTSTVHGA
jgi:hypothetical protein